MNWQRCSGQLLALVTNYPNSRHFLLHRHRRTTDHAPRFRTWTLSRLPSSRRCSPSHRPSPHAKPPKLLAVPEPAAPDPGSQILPGLAQSEVAAGRTRGQGARFPGLPSGVGRSSPLPLRARPVPKEDTLPPAGSPPPAAPPPRARPPALALAPSRSRQPASEGSALGWDLEEAAKEGDSGSASGFFPAPTSGLPEESRGSERDEASEEDLAAAPCPRFPRRRRRRQRRLQVSRARSPGVPVRPRGPRGADDRLTPTRPTDEQIGRAWHPRTPALPGWRPAPAARRPQTTTSLPRPVAPDPRGRQSPRGTAALRDPQAGAVGPPRPGEFRARSPRRRAPSAAATPGSRGGAVPRRGTPWIRTPLNPGKADSRSTDLR